MACVMKPAFLMQASWMLALMELITTRTRQNVFCNVSLCFVQYLGHVYRSYVFCKWCLLLSQFKQADFEYVVYLLVVLQ